jgi:hypothetical protein
MTDITPANTPAKPITLEQFCNYIAPGSWDQEEFLQWPPDVFAVVASLLLKSGAYCYAISGWKRKPSLAKWIERTELIGKAWRDNGRYPPAQVLRWHRWLTSKKNRRVPVGKIQVKPSLCRILLELCAAADEASRGVGFGMSADDDPFLFSASMYLFLTGETLNASTLCSDRIDHSTVRVLPKLHTPQSGITIRSLTHHLALCPAGDVKAKWAEYPCADRHYFNLLIAPWPVTASPAHFIAVEPTKAELLDMPAEFGFFEYNPPPDIGNLSKLKRMLKNARRVVNEIHGVVFPELALTRREYNRISKYLMEQDIFLICGVREGPPSIGKAGKNYLQFDIPFMGSNFQSQHEQSKHHRWRLDKREIVQYGLGSCLDVTGSWWEHISVGNRTLYFVTLDNWLTVCPLICEDLARQDPVGEMVRAVGPNLVIALLMDGPQLNSRWPARYATVLADDPGSSVLTLTSLGMSELSRPPSIKEQSRAVALWKDAKTGETVSIELPKKKDGIILSLSRDHQKEWSADGRDDGGSTGYPVLSGIHFVDSA